MYRVSPSLTAERPAPAIAPPREREATINSSLNLVRAVRRHRSAGHVRQSTNTNLSGLSVRREHRKERRNPVDAVLLTRCGAKFSFEQRLR